MNDKVVPITQKNTTYTYKSYVVSVTYRPRYKDYRWRIKRSIEVTESDNSPTFDAAKRAAERYIDILVSVTEGKST